MRPMNNLKPTSVGAIVVAAVAAALIGAVTALSFYGNFPPIHVYSSAGMWIVAIVCAVCARIVKRKIDDGEVGQDASQISPLTVAVLGALGRAVAWAGAVVGGGYAGVSVYVLMRAGELSAAQSDVPGALAGMIGGGLAAAAGLWLERSCVAPPPDSPMETNLDAAY